MLFAALVVDTVASMQVGDVIAGRFELESRVGAGGMGTVYRARDRQSGAAVALEVLFDRARDARARRSPTHPRRGA